MSKNFRKERNDNLIFFGINLTLFMVKMICV